MQRIITDDLDLLLDALPPHICGPLKEREDNFELLEIVMDLGRRPEARYPGREVMLAATEVTAEDLDYVVARIGEFGEDNRAGIERTLHRISCIRNRRGRIVGLTCRVGRAVFGTIKVIEDLIKTGRSTLLLGRPGVGKTTMLREVARVLADDMNKRVVIVDTSNEIAGDGDIPHPAIGQARRMQVPKPALQHAVMIEAVENHMPEVIVIDEIGTELEAAAARTIAERGVQLVATAHGTELENLMLNPTLADLVGGIQSVTLGDEEARRRGTQKSILERKAPPTFDVVVEIQSWERVAVHGDVAETVDALLRGYKMPAEVRELGEDDEVRVVQQPAAAPAFAAGQRPGAGGGWERRRGATEGGGPPGGDQPFRRLYPFGISRKRLEQAIRETGSRVAIAEELADADTVMTLRSYFRRKPQALRDAEARGIPIYVLKTNTVAQMEQSLFSMRQHHNGETPTGPIEMGAPAEYALQETEDAITGMLNSDERSVELTPQNAYIRRLQHQMAQRYNLVSRSQGREPYRRVRIYREDPGAAYW
ncbi:MAG TPA: R3H domain-containing nucleic acid-binding protein [Dehalococcoidia bacterium]|nr:R3H domain-containing nucleic acid-binding protein [Dehalococcoidia bacterium]